MSDNTRVGPGPWRFAALVAAAAIGAWFIRMLPFLWRGSQDLRVSYDESCYFVSAVLFVKGLIPYHDFVYVHPPGFLYVLGAIATVARGWDLAAGLDLARWTVIAAGVVNVVLVGRLARSAFGPVAGVAAAVVYACHPATALFERRALIEPVLNLACLGLATAWLRGKWTESTRPAVAAGAWLAVAASLKLWGVFWVWPCLLSLPAGFTWRHARAMTAAGFVVTAVIVLPLLTVAPEAFVAQTWLLHAWRPPDGLGRVDRIAEILRTDAAYLPWTICVVVGLATVARRGRAMSRDARFWAAAWITIALAFMATRAFFGHYIVHLMAPGAVLVGLGASSVWSRISPLPIVARAGAAAVASAALCLTVVLVVKEPTRLPLRLDAARVIQAQVPDGSGLQAINPAWSVIGNRLPRLTPGVPVMVDSYSAGLLAALRYGARFADARAALQTPAAQAVARAAFLGSGHVLTSRSAEWQLSPDTWRWMRECFAVTASIEPPGGDERLALWRRRPTPCQP